MATLLFMDHGDPYWLNTPVDCDRHTSAYLRRTLQDAYDAHVGDGRRICGFRAFPKNMKGLI